MKIYTKTGDMLTTSTIKDRVSKDDLIIECLGTIDEASSTIMLAANFVQKEDVKEILIELVKDLFDLSGDILKVKDRPSVNAIKVSRLEEWIDYYQERVPEIHGFILPGTTIACSHIHLARTVVRRLERRLVKYGKNNNLYSENFQYINRLSDLLFTLARYME